MSNIESNDYTEVTLVTGEHLFILRKNVVGYCRFNGHKGSITKSILKKRECDKKKCYYLQKYEDNQYWKTVEQVKVARQRAKKNAKRIKNEEREMQKNRIEMAQKVADNLGYKLRVINIKKVPQKKSYILFYISAFPKNDWYIFFDLAKELGVILKGRVELKHVKDIEGNYVVM